MKISRSIQKAWPKIKVALTIQLVGTVFSCLCALCSYCATGYLADRLRDGADIFTFAVGNGVGITTRMGPVHAGIFCGEDQIGMRVGEFGMHLSATTFDPLIVCPDPGGGPWCFWHESDFGGLQTVPDPRGGIMSLASARAKEYSVRGNCPLVAIPVLSEADLNAGFKYPVHFLTEIEIALGVWKTFRLGFNPGELLDFLLGWTTIDIFNDDLEARRQKEELNPASNSHPWPRHGWL